MTFQEFAFFLMSIAAGTAGQFFLKTGAQKLGRVNTGNFLGHVLSIATTPELLIGLVFYGVGAVLYILLLTRVKLSVLGPAVALQYIFAVLMGKFIFDEPIPLTRVAGMGLIICGVILLISRD
ncbi:EamA-like transporter family protein [Phormidesmis priestleyi ULC007]|uniref:EamA-like transporter family protein n=1 Tax=Phormidesmis priestleyi ULC007 TaxID=1920490 RepID=A0A2T1DBY4_9CYAN|nr:EamA-like transporter family protein [Phormidesmis priestleyi]PSB17998.1 EamA-like transporter family protein [Phormidesmis priestleyi ULC007]PZO49338.1 MAG: EamA-like transporter family protein [Phormidesmis priestleyi]